MKNKRELPKPTAAETEAGITRFILVEDLTPDNHRTLAALSKSKLTDKVWSVDGRIKFTKANRPDVVMTVKSVYDPITNHSLHINLIQFCENNNFVLFFLKVFALFIVLRCLSFVYVYKGHCVHCYHNMLSCYVHSVHLYLSHYVLLSSYCLHLFRYT